jgi:putative transposase
VQWQDGNGWALNEKSQRLRLHGIGHVKVRHHRPARGTPKTITVRREGRRFWVSIHCVEVPAEPLPATGREVGIDLGVESLLATSDGRLADNARVRPSPPGGPGHRAKGTRHQDRGFPASGEGPGTGGG